MTWEVSKCSDADENNSESHCRMHTIDLFNQQYRVLSRVLYLVPHDDGCFLFSPVEVVHRLG